MVKVNDDRYDHFKDDKVSDYPPGYPRVAAFLNADIDGRAYRCFGQLRNRLLLHHQDKVVFLEQQLQNLDAEHATTNPFRLKSRRYDEQNPQDSKRKELLVQIEEALKNYDELLLREDAIMRLQPVSKRSHRHYFDYILNNKPFCKEEYEFVYHRRDFVALGGTPDDNWFGPFVDVIRTITPKWFLDILFKSKRERHKSDSDDLDFYSNSRTEILTKAVLGTLSTLMILLPAVIFYVLTSNGVSGGARLGALATFVVAFSVVLLTMTSVSRSELFGASAAYCAVLVVFLGNVPQTPQ